MKSTIILASDQHAATTVAAVLVPDLVTTLTTDWPPSAPGGARHNKGCFDVVDARRHQRNHVLTVLAAHC